MYLHLTNKIPIFVLQADVKAEVFKSETEVHKLKADIMMFKQHLQTKEEELDDAKCQISSQAASVERAQMEVLELKTELELAQATSHHDKGNSLFSEVRCKSLLTAPSML